MYIGDMYICICMSPERGEAERGLVLVLPILVLILTLAQLRLARGHVEI